MGTLAVDVERSPLDASMTSKIKGMMKHEAMLCVLSVQVHAGGPV